MGFKCGIVGLPNVGKSTLFNALTNGNVAAQNYPFCTIEPNIGLINVPDHRLEKIASLAGSEKIIPASIEFVDIAGLVAGAAAGEGLGNKFLSHIREVDAIIHLVRCFEDPNIIHVANKIDPIKDLEIITTELLLADLSTVEQHIAKIKKKPKQEIGLGEFLTKLQQHLNNGNTARTMIVPKELAHNLSELHLLTSKPVMYVANVNEAALLEANQNQYITAILAHAEKLKIPALVICAAIEAEISKLPLEEQAEFLENLGLTESGLEKLIKHGYRLLNLQTFFTAGPKEVRAWTIEANSFAPVAAGKIHTDFQKGFIRAEVVSYNDFLNYSGYQGAKEAGKWRLEGKDYVVQDGDVMIFRFNP